MQVIGTALILRREWLCLAWKTEPYTSSVMLSGKACSIQITTKGGHPAQIWLLPQEGPSSKIR